MPKVNDLLRERHPELLAEEARAFRWLQAARKLGKKVAIAIEAYTRACTHRRIAENAIRRELGLDPISLTIDTEAPR
jgi:hypothetical protein